MKVSKSIDAENLFTPHGLFKGPSGRVSNNGRASLGIRGSSVGVVTLQMLEGHDGVPPSASDWGDAWEETFIAPGLHNVYFGGDTICRVGVKAGDYAGPVEVVLWQ